MKHTHKLIALMLTLFMLTGLVAVPNVSLADSGAATPTDANFIAPIDRDNIPSDAIYITTAAELASIGGADSEGKYYVLDNDIDLVGKWAPIDEFRGTLDGQGYCINNLWIQAYTETGFFRRITGNAAVKNLGINTDARGVLGNAWGYGTSVAGILAARVSADGTDTVLIENCFTTGFVDSFAPNHGDPPLPSEAGGMIGYVSGRLTIKNCYTNVDVYSSLGGGGMIGSIDAGHFSAVIVEDCFAVGNVTVYSENIASPGGAGGLIGSCYFSAVDSIIVKNCYASGSVESGSSGGLICSALGDGSMTLSNSYATGNSSGYSASGLVDYCENISISNCYATGDVFGSYQAAGGLVAVFRDVYTGDDTVEINNSYRPFSQNVIFDNAATPSPYSTPLGINDCGEPLTDEQMRNPTSFVGWDFDDVWTHKAGENNGFPVLRVFDGVEIAPSPYFISSVTLNKTKLPIMAGTSETLVATVHPPEAKIKDIEWNIDNGEIADIDENGVVTGISDGTTTVIAIAKAGERKYAECTVTVSGSGIDYTPISDIIIKGKIDDVEQNDYLINLSQETIKFPNTYTPVAFSVDGGNKWKKIKDDIHISEGKHPFHKVSFHKLFGKDMTLHLSDKPYDKRAKTLGDGATVVTFDKINKRTVLPKLKVNYELGADATGESTGMWVLAQKAPVESLKEGLLIAEADTDKKTPNTKGFGKFLGANATNNGIVVKPLVSGKQVKSTYLYKIGAVGEPGTYTAASKTQKASVKGQGKAPNCKAKNDIIKVKAGTSVDLGGTQTDYKEKAEVNVSGYTGSVKLWAYATPKKPASKKQELTLS